MELKTSAEPRVLAPNKWRLLGHETAVKRKGTPVKINGSGKFAKDMALDNQLVIVITHAPRMSAKVSSFDASEAKE